ncbi:MAG TPA: rhodanese-like domain-containing protein [Ilumatobacter sp.]
MIQITSPERRVSPAELDALIGQHADVRVLDVRTPGEFETAHIPGAYNIPLTDLGDALEELSGVSLRLVVVCQSGSRADTACSRLVAAGLEGVEMLDGGMAAWQRAGGRVRRARHRWDLERQVRLVAGSLVLGSALASIVKPAARVLAGAIGAGLVVAAVTNRCTMGMALAKLPINRPRDVWLDAATTARHLRAGTTPVSPNSDSGAVDGACPAA